MWLILRHKDASSHMFGSSAIEVLLSEVILSGKSKGSGIPEHIEQVTANTIDKLRMNDQVDCHGKVCKGRYILSRNISLQTLAGKIAQGTYPYPLIFGKAMAFCQRDIVEDIKAGIQSLGLRYFPDLKYWSDARNALVSWDQSRVLQIIDEGRETREERLAEMAQSLTSDVMINLHATGIVYRSVIHKMNHIDVFPWMEQIVHRIPENKIREKDFILNLATFVSAIALHESGFYVAYDALFRLVFEGKVNQRELRDWHILSQNRLVLMKQGPIYHLHESIEHHLPKLSDSGDQVTSRTYKTATDYAPLVEKEIETFQVKDNITRISLINRNCTHLRWTAAEENILMEIVNLYSSEKRKPLQEMYAIYEKRTKEQHIGTRTFKAFKRKIEKI